MAGTKRISKKSNPLVEAPPPVVESTEKPSSQDRLKDVDELLDEIDEILSEAITHENLVQYVAKGGE